MAQATTPETDPPAKNVESGSTTQTSLPSVFWVLPGLLIFTTVVNFAIMIMLLSNGVIQELPPIAIISYFAFAAIQLIALASGVAYLLTRRDVYMNYFWRKNIDRVG